MTTPDFTIQCRVALQRAVVWSRMWDLEAHTREVPFTTVQQISTGRENSEGLSMGAVFDGCTRLGPIVIHDVMRVDQWDVERRARITKIGRVLRGTIEVHLDEIPEGTRITWRQSYGVRFVPDFLARLMKPLVRAGYQRTLMRILGTCELKQPASLPDDSTQARRNSDSSDHSEA